MALKLYLAAPFEKLPFMRTLAAGLTAAGHVVTSRWLQEDPDDKTMNESLALRDLQDIDQADAMIVYNPPDFYHNGTGGRHVELGYALGQGIPIVLLGAASNVFHHLENVRVVASHSQLHVALETLPSPL